MDSFHMVYLSINQARIENIQYSGIWKELKRFVERNKLDKSGNYLSFAFDDYLITESDKSRFYIRYTINADTEPIGKFGVMKVEKGLFAVFQYNGAYSQLENIYANIYLNWISWTDYIIRDSYSFEIYIRTPDDVSPDDLITDIYIPIERKR